MNVTNVIPLSPLHAVPFARGGPPPVANPVRVRFDAFELDEPDALLLRDGKAVALAPRPFAVLCALARRPGALLTKPALLDAVWGHQFVSDSVLKTAVSEVRRALDDHPRQPRFIDTVSRRGYRFIASTHPISTSTLVRAIDRSWPPSCESGSESAPDPAAARYVTFSRMCMRCPQMPFPKGRQHGAGRLSFREQVPDVFPGK